MLKLEQDKGRFRVRVKLEGRYKAIYLGTTDRYLAEEILSQMQQDYENGSFDITGESYKVTEAIQVRISIRTRQRQQVFKVLFQEYRRYREMGGTESQHLYFALRCIDRHSNNARWNQTQWFLELRNKLKSYTWNYRRSMYAACVGWGIEQGIVSSGINPWSAIKPKREPRDSKADPFTHDEVTAIITAFATDRYRHPNSPYSQSHYTPFVIFLLTYGTRLGEAIALTWAQVDFERNIITIDAAMGRDFERSLMATAKVRKSTKTGVVRYLPLTDEIKTVLLQLRQTNRRRQLHDHIFEGHVGRYIDTRNFRLVWKRVLNGLNIPYRYPYQCRHTVLSHVASEHGLAAAASLAGHRSLDMASRHYVKFTGSIVSIIPQWNI